MKHTPFILLLLVATISKAQIDFSIGGGIGYMNNTTSVSTQFKAQAVFAKRISIEGSAAFSRMVPFEHSVKLGYVFNPLGKIQIVPGIAITKYTFANHDKHLNYNKYNPAIEVSYQLSLEGTNGEAVFDHVKIFIDHIGSYTGAGLRLAFRELKIWN